MSELRTDFKDEILQEGETHRVYNIKRKGTDEVVESEVYLEKAYEALQEGDEFGAKDVNEIHVRLNGLASMNLLINSFFQNYIINQRGLASYSADKTNKYTIDRWYAFNVYVDVNNDEGLLGLKTSGEGMLRQIFENPLLSNVYTVSISVPRVVSGTLKIYCQGYEDDVLVIDSVGIYTYTFTEKEISRFILHTVNFEGSISWMKLEPGSIATPLVPRPYGEELALCQRYYQLHSEVMFAKSTSDTYFWGSNLSVEMRTDPTLEKYMLYTSSAKDVTSSFSSCTVWNRMLYLIILKSSISDSALRCSLWLDAEIY